MLEKIFELANKTGDRCIVWDRQSQKAFVILPFEKYEELLIDHVNISASNAQDEDDIDFGNEIPEGEEDEREYYFEPIE